MSNNIFLKEFESVRIFDRLSEFITKVCGNDSYIFLLTQSKFVYFAKHTPMTIDYEKVNNVQAIDIACNTNLLYYVDVQGCVFTLDIPNFNKKEEILITEDTKFCIHGFKCPSNKAKIKSVYVSKIGEMFLNIHGKLWASGSMPELSVNSSKPKQVSFFENYTIYDVGLGQDFGLVLARKNITKEIEHDMTESDIKEQIFLPDCLECQASGKILPPDSFCSMNEVCPLGLAIAKTSGDSSTTSNVDAEKQEGASSVNEEDISSLTEEINKFNKNVVSDISDGVLNYSVSCNKIEAYTPNTQQNVENVQAGTDETLIFHNSECKDDEKRNLIFDPDSTKNFLAKQLSRMYVGDDYLNEYAEKPTHLFKQNVSHLTSLVFEGVKTVGDKVVNLSRQMNKQSDANDVGIILNDSVPIDMHSSIFSCNYNSIVDELHASTSTIASDKETQNNVFERTSILLSWGHYILNSEVWIWGDNKYGQLGSGDNIARSRPILVSRLIGLGVQKVACGKHHCAALSLDGRLFLWGRNNSNQLSLDCNDDKSSPCIFTCNSNADRVRDVACGSKHTIIYTTDDSLLYLGMLKDLNATNKISLLPESDNIKMAMKNDKFIEQSNRYEEHTTHPVFTTENNCFHWKLLAADTVSFFHKYTTMNSPAIPDLAIEQQFLEELLLIYYSLIKHLLKKSGNSSEETNNYELLCNTFSNVMYFTAVNVLSLWRFTEGHCNELNVSVIENHDEQLKIYSNYLDAVCNIITLNGFNHIASIIEIPPVLQRLFTDKLPTSEQNSGKKTSKTIILSAFLYPLNRLSSYRCIIQSLIRCVSKHPVTDMHKSITKKLKDVLSQWEGFIADVNKNLKQAEITKDFWETSGKVLLPLLTKHELVHSSKRRYIRDSKNNPLGVVRAGRFSSHWFVLFGDILIHMNNNVLAVHPLATLWVEPLVDTDVLQNSIRLITPEEIIHVCTATSEEKNDWLHVLESSIKCYFNKTHGLKAPLTRIASYNFSSKNQMYKDAEYTGRWYVGKLHGAGKIEWPDGKVYIGDFNLNRIHGHGQMKIPNVGIYDGHWKDDLQNGYGIMKYESGEVHEGYFKDGLAHGHGMRRQGDFTTSSASLYIGEWVAGVRQGYGIINDIVKGEKYLGNWNDNKKHGCGLIVTLDGIYYEGVFMQDVLMGHGVMVFENGTHYEGEFKSAGTFSGKGVLTLSSGDKIEGILSGSWIDGVKISNATLNLNVNTPDVEQCSFKPSSFGKLCVAPNQKWNALFRECFQQLGVSDKYLSPSGNCFLKSCTCTEVDSKKLWHNVAVFITHSHQQSLKIGVDTSFKNFVKHKKSTSIENLQMLPNFGQSELSIESYEELKQYVIKACDSVHHPLGKLVQDVTTAFNATYGGVRVHPLLLSHAVKELKSIISRIYCIVLLLFPALPDDGIAKVLPKDSTSAVNDGIDVNPVDGEVVSASTLLQPVLLPCVHPSLFVLYALHNKQEDDMYWKRLLKWNKQADITLMVFLGIDQKFWVGYTFRNPETSAQPYSPLQEKLFKEAIETLQQLKTTFSPIEKLLVIRSTFQQITSVVQEVLGPSYVWSMDELFPVFHFVVVRAQILQLGSEIHFIDDFLETCMQNGELGIMFTTLKACYFQILQENVTINT